MEQDEARKRYRRWKIIKGQGCEVCGSCENEVVRVSCFSARLCIEHRREFEDVFFEMEEWQAWAAAQSERDVVAWATHSGALPFGQAMEENRRCLTKVDAKQRILRPRLAQLLLRLINEYKQESRVGGQLPIRGAPDDVPMPPFDSEAPSAKKRG